MPKVRRKTVPCPICGRPTHPGRMKAHRAYHNTFRRERPAPAAESSGGLLARLRGLFAS